MYSKDLIQELLDIPSKIHELEEINSKLKDFMKEKSDELNLLETNHKMNINSEMRGKVKVYGNEEQRKAELYIRMTNDRDCILLDKEIKEISSELYANNSRIHLLGNRQSNIRSILGYLKSNSSIEELFN